MTFIEKLSIGMLAYLFVASVLVGAIDFAKFIGRRLRYRQAAARYNAMAASMPIEWKSTTRIVTVSHYVDAPPIQSPLFGRCPRLLDEQRATLPDWGTN